MLECSQSDNRMYKVFRQCLPFQIPRWLFRLTVLLDVETTHGYVVYLQQVRDININMPMEPGPKLPVMTYWRVWVLF